MSISASLIKIVQGCLASLLLASSAWADNFGVVKVDTRSMIMINIDTIATTPEGYKRAWVATAWSGHQRDNIYGVQDYIEYDCTRRRYRIISTIAYGRDNSPLKTLKYKSVWRRERPKTNSYIGSNIVCNTLGIGGGLLTGDEFALIKSYRGVAAKR
ncbi:surface-adhesin E family protein [Phenylobacterium sp. LjRoot225]|uniref:surface-adhesin E family protein n=1 Tax=Phenylobacterium sp. LjRoot225 TaxID=3342285 RepID=UPI003F4F5727